MSDKRDLLIAGGGLVGMTLALAAARNGLTSHVIDPADPEDVLAETFDGRASAVSTASWNLFHAIGLADRLEPHGQSIEAIAVTDRHRPGRIDFRPEPQEGTLGRMFANRTLRAALFEAAREEDGIAWHWRSRIAERRRDPYRASATLENGTTLEAALLVGAEGRRSPTRREAGIAIARWDYRHQAIVAGLVHDQPHDGIAWEIFYDDGPFALLPMRDDEDGRHRSSLVWTVPEAQAAGMLKLGDRAFLAEAEGRAGGVLGKLLEAGPRAAWPLGFHHAGRITDERLALVGDAAHGLHPIAGQGFNLGLRDVGALVEVLVEGRRLGLDAGDAQMLARYERWRALDTASVAIATDTLTRLFEVPGRAASALRRAGMAGVQRLSPLKTFFMDEARGVSGDVPELMRG